MNPNQRVSAAPSRAARKSPASNSLDKAEAAKPAGPKESVFRPFTAGGPPPSHAAQKREIAAVRANIKEFLTQRRSDRNAMDRLHETQWKPRGSALTEESLQLAEDLDVAAEQSTPAERSGGDEPATYAPGFMSDVELSPEDKRQLLSDIDKMFGLS